MTECRRRELYQERNRARQKAYAQKHRQKLKQKKRPDARDVAGALLAITLEKVVETGRTMGSGLLTRHLVDEMGYDQDEVVDVLAGMVERYRYATGR